MEMVQTWILLASPQSAATPTLPSGIAPHDNSPAAFENLALRRPCFVLAAVGLLIEMAALAMRVTYGHVTILRTCTGMVRRLPTDGARCIHGLLVLPLDLEENFLPFICI